MYRKKDFINNISLICKYFVLLLTLTTGFVNASGEQVVTYNETTDYIADDACGLFHEYREQSRDIIRQAPHVSMSDIQETKVMYNVRRGQIKSRTNQPETEIDRVIHRNVAPLYGEDNGTARRIIRNERIGENVVEELEGNYGEI